VPAKNGNTKVLNACTLVPIQFAIQVDGEFIHYRMERTPEVGRTRLGNGGFEFAMGKIVCQSAVKPSLMHQRNASVRNRYKGVAYEHDARLVGLSVHYLTL
jgi:hypothetical protein